MQRSIANDIKVIESDTYESVCSFLNRFEGDIFRIIVPLNNNYSYDKIADDLLMSADKTAGKSADKVMENAGKVPINIH